MRGGEGGKGSDLFVRGGGRERGDVLGGGDVRYLIEMYMAWVCLGDDV